MEPAAAATDDSTVPKTTTGRETGDGFPGSFSATKFERPMSGGFF